MVVNPAEKNTIPINIINPTVFCNISTIIGISIIKIMLIIKENYIFIFIESESDFIRINIPKIYDAIIFGIEIINETF